MNQWSTLIIFNRDFLFWCLFFTASSFKAGKLSVPAASPGLFACQNVSFTESFHGGQEITVFASLGRSIKSPARGNGGAIWVESIDKYGFMACILEYSNGYNRTAEVDWVAMQSLPSGAQIGTTSLDSWTTGTICKRIDFQQVSFVCKPVFFFPVKY